MRRTLLAICILFAPVSVSGQLPDPAMTVSSSFTGFEAVYAQDENVNTDWASNGNGANTFADFNFGAPTLIRRVEYTDRRTSGGLNGSFVGGSADNVLTFNLIFSTDATFGNGDDIVVPVNSPGVANTDTVLINGGAGYTAQYVRFDVVTTSGANPGAAEFEFYATADIPTASTGVVLLLAATLLGVAIVRLR